jgi:ketosteroid isomerase-like protein
MQQPPLNAAVRDTQRTMPEESTTPALVERWRETNEAFVRRDFDATMSFFAPDAVWNLSSAGIGRFEGTAASARSHRWSAPRPESQLERFRPERTEGSADPQGDAAKWCPATSLCAGCYLRFTARFVVRFVDALAAVLGLDLTALFFTERALFLGLGFAFTGTNRSSDFRGYDSRLD